MTSPNGSTWSAGAESTPHERTLNGARHLPGISIVVTSNRETAHLRRCLGAFVPVWAEAGAQVVIVHAGERAELVGLVQQFSSALWITTDPGTQESDLRRMGLERSTCDIVVFVEDRDVLRCQWIATLCRNWRAWSETGGRVINAPLSGSAESIQYPYLSVVMPVRNGGSRFLLALQGLALSDLPRQMWELVVVDDGSTDETPAVAAQYADKFLRLRPGARGPGYARNRGFEVTLGECVAFINADVMVEPDTLRNAATLLSQHPELQAVFGSCCASAVARGFLSEYRSLVQRHYHEKNADDAVIFSSACGIVRSSIFERAGGYDEWHFSRRQLEDLEFGQRIRALGERIVPHSDIRATHLRKWTLRRMVTTEILDRTVPWMRLVKQELLRDSSGAPPRRRVKNLKIGMSWLTATCSAAAWLKHDPRWAIAAVLSMVVLLVSNGPQLAFFARERGLRFAVFSVPVDFFYYMIAGVGIASGWLVRQAFGEPTPGAVAEAYAEMGRKRWPPVPVKRIARPSSAAPDRPAPLPSAGVSQIPLPPQGPASGEAFGEASNILQ